MEATTRAPAGGWGAAMTDAALPETVAPMLAGASAPFDSDEHVFEIKWDGLRAIVRADGESWSLRNRRGTDVTSRYPDLLGLGRLPAGTIVDGEVVVLRDGLPDFEALQSRWNVTGARRVAVLAAQIPVTYVAFDLLYDGFRPVLSRALVRRRERLREIVEALGEPRVAFSDGVVGAGRAYFEEAARRGLEGIMAKRLVSRYVPGRRSDAWLKIKARKLLHCAILGYVPEGEDDLKSLIVAAPGEDGTLRSVGRVGSGIDGAARERLNRLLRERPRAEPLVPCADRGRWVEPGLYCRVSFQELTRAGELRAPVFRGLVEE